MFHKKKKKKLCNVASTKEYEMPCELPKHAKSILLCQDIILKEFTSATPPLQFLPR